MQLYYHKTDGGAEYLTDKFHICPNGEKEGRFKGSKYIVRIDGDIEKDAELMVNDEPIKYVIDYKEGYIVARVDNEYYYSPLSVDLTTIDPTQIVENWGVIDDYDVEDPDKLEKIKKAFDSATDPAS